MMKRISEFKAVSKNIFDINCNSNTTPRDKKVTKHKLIWVERSLSNTQQLSSITASEYTIREELSLQRGIVIDASNQ